jgi:hypothetical protein
MKGKWSGDEGFSVWRLDERWSDGERNERRRRRSFGGKDVYFWDV